jgi:beta-phosphoglucomutase family hydrolase
VYTKQNLEGKTLDKDLSNVSAIIFDMDGLMFDTERLVINAWEKVGKEFGIDISKDIVIETMGLNVLGTEKVFKKHLGDDFPFYEIRGKRVKYVMDFIEKNGVPVKPGLYELLELLEQMKIQKAVATSTEREKACKVLTFAGVVERFDSIVYGDEIKNGKPNPDIFLKAAEHLGVSPEKCIVLEDSENGIKAAYKAGMYPIMIPDVKQPSAEVSGMAFKIFDSLVEFREYFRKIKS